MIVAIASAIAVIATIVLAVRALRTENLLAPAGSRRVSIAWCVLFLALMAFIGVWSGRGLTDNDPVSAIVVNAILVACAAGALDRERIRARLEALTAPGARFPHPTALTVIILLVAGVFATLALELPSNHDITWMYPLCLLLEWALITTMIAGLFFLFQRRGAAPAVFVFALLALGIAEYFVILYKSMPLTPGDLSAISTAASVSSGYTLAITPFCLYGIAAFAVSCFLLATAALLRPDRAHRTRKKLLINLLVGVLCLGGLTAHVVLLDYYNTLYIQVYTWRPLESYYRMGFLPSFISEAQTIVPPKPEDYSTDKADELLSSYAESYDSSAGATESRAAATAQFDEEKPTVIAIMNETFSDLSIYQEMHAGYEGPQYFKSLSDALVRGTLYVSAYGGGTANSEFEFLTGNSMAYLGNGVYPYTIYNLSQTDNLAAQFKNLGYTTTAMHPNHATNWNRENVYEDFGFDQFLSIDDFQDSEKLRGMVTDKATYDKILEMLDENSDPQFIFDVTMQNHSGYETGLLPSNKLESYQVDGQENAEINEYLSLIEESDRALAYFLGQLRQLDRKVVVVFFGDHQPFFPSTYNDAWFTGEDEATHAERLWQTDYVIWANYNVAGCDQTSQVDDTSTNYLGAMLMHLIGAPMSDYQKAQITLREAIPAINVTGYCDRNRSWYLSNAARAGSTGSADGDEATSVRNDLATLQYRGLFDHEDGLFTKKLQSAANETDPNLAPGTTKIK